jgi:hypothetical protein
MDSLRLDRRTAAFLIGVPVAWAALLLFHPQGDGTNIYTDLHDQVTVWMVVHTGTLFFIGLMAFAIFVLVRDLPGTAARIAMWGAAVFAVFYTAWETVAGLVDGALVQHANGLPLGQRGQVEATIQSLHDNWAVGDFGLLNSVGSLAWITAAIAAAVAVRKAGAPLAAAVLIGLSSMATAHPPPFGPIGLAFFAVAVVMIYRAQPAEAARPVPPTPPAVGVRA